MFEFASPLSSSFFCSLLLCVVVVALTSCGYVCWCLGFRVLAENQPAVDVVLMVS